jgi:hypothetical protein
MRQISVGSSTLQALADINEVTHQKVAIPSTNDFVISPQPSSTGFLRKRLL